MLEHIDRVVIDDLIQYFYATEDNCLSPTIFNLFIVTRNQFLLAESHWVLNLGAS